MDLLFEKQVRNLLVLFFSQISPTLSALQDLLVTLERRVFSAKPFSVANEQVHIHLIHNL